MFYRKFVMEEKTKRSLTEQLSELQFSHIIDYSVGIKIDVYKDLFYGEMLTIGHVFKIKYNYVYRFLLS